MVDQTDPALLSTAAIGPGSSPGPVPHIAVISL